MKKKLLLAFMIMSSSMNAASLKSTFIRADRCNSQTVSIVKAVFVIIGFAYLEAKIQRMADHLLDNLIDQPDKN